MISRAHEENAVLILYMKPKVFLRIGGVLLTTLGILGLVGILGQISKVSFFHPPYWVNYFHLIFGVIILFVSFSPSQKIHAVFTSFAMVIGITIGILGLLLGGYLADKYGLPELKDPSDHIAHLIVGLSAFWAWKNRAS